MKYIGLLPYIYLDNPLKIGAVRFVPLIVGEKNTRRSAEDNRHLQNVIALFRDGLGNPLVAATYFIVDVPKESSVNLVIDEIQTSIHIFRFSLLNSQNSNLSFEQTFLYLFEIPPVYEHLSDNKNSYSYRCLINLQNDLYPHNNMIIYPPVTDLRTSVISKGDFYNLEQLQNNYFGNPLGLTDLERERVLIAIDWYNQTFQTHPVIDERGKIVDMAIAFEVLLNLPAENITSTFCSCVQILLGSSVELSSWSKDFYNARSRIVHNGKARTYLYKHPEAATEHVSLLGSARKIFIWCIDTMLGDIRGMHTDEISLLLTSSEVYLKHLKKAKNFQELKSQGLLEEISLLRPSYPVGNKQDIINLGKLLLQSYKSSYVTAEHKPLPTLDRILSFKDADTTKLGLLYYSFIKEFESIYFRYISITDGTSVKDQLKQQKPEPITDLDRMKLEQAVYGFAQFAGFALLLPNPK